MKYRPNDPCHCGSGKKFKKCHGSPVNPEPDAGQWLKRGRKSLLLGRDREAEGYIQRALRVSPNYADAWKALGELAERAGDFDAAGQCYGRLIELQPENAQARFQLGNVFARQYDFEKARTVYREATRLMPGLQGIWVNLGNVEKYLGRFPEAMACYQRAVELETDPERKVRLHSLLLFSMHFDESVSHEDLFRAHVDWAESHARPLYQPDPVWPNRPDALRPLRVGYVSGSFNGEIISHFLKGVLAQHDPGQCRVYLFSSTRVEDADTAVVRKSCHEWIDISQSDDGVAAESIRSRKIDIAVDLDGHSPTGRPLVFARGVAPVQVEWLDYFNTSGMECMDYILTDPYTTPDGSPQQYSETPFRLPATRFCYSPPDYAPAVSPAPCLAGRPFTFGSFNRQDKLHPELLRLWANILLQAPGSRLLLKNRALEVPAVQHRLKDSFTEFGISPDRLVLKGPSPHREMLAEYGEIDVALDSFPYNGGLTTCECLWMGVPVVALEAERMIGRQTSAMLRLLGLDDWVAGTPEDYVRLAVEKGRGGAGLKGLREQLRQRMSASPLCDASRFTRDLEQAYLTMWRQYCKQHFPSQHQPAPRGAEKSSPGSVR